METHTTVYWPGLQVSEVTSSPLRIPRVDYQFGFGSLYTSPLDLVVPRTRTDHEAFQSLVRSVRVQQSAIGN